MSIGDAHVYTTHFEQVAQQLLRPCREFPQIEIKNIKSKIEDYTTDDIVLSNYNPHPAIRAEMAV